MKFSDIKDRMINYLVYITALFAVATVGVTWYAWKAIRRERW